MRRGARGAGPEREVTVERLGGAGDGIARTPEGIVYVPLTLPGERWLVRLGRRAGDGWHAEPVREMLLQDRAVPPCPHFGRCGGCRLQHLPTALYAAHKRERILAALTRRGLPTGMVEPPRITPPMSRRRLRLGLAAVAGRLVIGLRARRSERIEPIDACIVARPEIAAAVPALARLLTPVLERPLPDEISLTSAEGGLDLLVHAGRMLSLGEREGLAAVAGELDLARVSWTAGGAVPEPIAARRPVRVQLAAVNVALPAGAFLQATAFGEQALQEAVRDWAGMGRRARDLFAGLGTLSFVLAETHLEVEAFEGDERLVAALRQGAAASRGVRIAAAVRDLARRPLTAAELCDDDLVVLDPPRAGAAGQAAELARSAVPKVIYASCHPESFARDARLLVDGGYRLAALRPIDQFLYAAEVELVALLTRQDETAPKQRA